MSLNALKNLIPGLLPVLVIWPDWSLAAETIPGQQAPDLFSAGIKMFYSMFLILGVMLLVLYVLKRLSAPGNRIIAPHGIIRVLATRRLDSRHFITVVEVGETVMTLGVTSDGISCLDKTAKNASGLIQPGSKVDSETSSFAQRLRSLSRLGSPPGGESNRA